MQYWEAAEEDSEKQKIPVSEVENLIDMFRSLVSTLDKEEQKMYKNMTEQKEVKVPENPSVTAELAREIMPEQNRFDNMVFVSEADNNLMQSQH